MGAISHYDRNHTAERDIDEMLREYERNNIITESESSKKWHEKYGCF